MHKERCQASSILVGPIQTVLQIILTEPHILLGILDQLSFRRSYEGLFVQTETFSTENSLCNT